MLTHKKYFSKDIARVRNTGMKPKLDICVFYGINSQGFIRPPYESIEMGARTMKSGFNTASKVENGFEKLSIRSYAADGQARVLVGYKSLREGTIIYPVSKIQH